MFCLAMRREVFEEVGPLDERFGLGLFEDDDYSMRLRRAGYRTVCAEDVFVHHFGEASFGGIACDGGYAGLLAANRKRFEQKWGVTWHPHCRRPDPRRDAEVEAVRRAVSENVPAGATVAVVSKGDEELVCFDERTGWHFPRGDDGVYAGHYPADGAAAAEHLEKLRAKGADYLLVPASASWWLEHYGQLALHLDRHHRRVLPDPEGCVLYALSASRETSPEALYLDLMKRCLTNWVYGDVEQPPFDPDKRADGRDWPPTAHTMVGLRRLDNVQRCVEDVLARGVPGDLIETGAWRGGACILMRAVLKANGVCDRSVWVADSFRGLPAPDADRYPGDAGDHHHAVPFLAVPLERVKENFRRYGLLDGQVKFLEGWFRDTLPNAPVDRLAVLRLDGDMYESTMDGLVHLYPKLSPGGYVIVDDYGYCANCRNAVDDYRTANGITAEIRRVDWTGVYWMK